MRKFKNKCLGGIAVMSVLACANLVQAGTAQAAAPKVTIHHQQVSSNQVNVDVGVTNLTSEVTALEVSLVADDISSVLQLHSKVENSYTTYQLLTQEDNKEKLSFYIVSEDKMSPFATNNGELAALSLSLQTGGRLTLEKDQISVKLIEKGYIIQSYEQAEVVYTETDYKPNEDTNGGNNNTGGNDGTTNGGNDTGGNDGSTNSGNNSSDDDDESSTSTGNSSINNGANNGNISTDNNADKNQNDTNKVSFTDLENHWAESAITNMASKGIIKGYADGSFKPSASITRGEFATLLARAFGLDKISEVNPFKDVAADKWYTDGIVALYHAGITSGRADGTFGVNAPITNEEISAMLYRTITALNMNMSEINPSGMTFTDHDKISPYAKEAIQNLVKMGIISGQPDGSFGAKNSTSRAQVAVMLNRVFTLKGY